MDYNRYFKDYYKSIYNLLDELDVHLINKSVDLIKKIKKRNNKI